jgi:hypothetical protein
VGGEAKGSQEVANAGQEAQSTGNVMSDDVGKFDQGAAFIGDNLPPLWRRIYVSCVEAGFLPHEAMELLKAYIFASAGGKGML